jgi:hypothetical protein
VLRLSSDGASGILRNDPPEELDDGLGGDQRRL